MKFMKTLPLFGRDNMDAEGWMEKHQHRMAFLRTVTSALGMIVSIIIAFKVFGYL